jgi:hypothetical protein
MKLDPKSLDQLKREVAKIPEQAGPRAETNRRRLLDWIGDLDGQAIADKEVRNDRKR